MLCLHGLNIRVHSKAVQFLLIRVKGSVKHTRNKEIKNMRSMAGSTMQRRDTTHLGVKSLPNIVKQIPYAKSVYRKAKLLLQTWFIIRNLFLKVVLMKLVIYSPCVIAVMERYMRNEKIGGINCHQPPPWGYLNLYSQWAVGTGAGSNV